MLDSNKLNLNSKHREHVAMGQKFCLKIEKENIKFSSAHFLIFNDHEAEMLHGHNYKVKAEIYLNTEQFKGQGFGIDFKIIKEKLKTLVDALDEHVLLPGKHPDMKIQDFDSKSIRVDFRDRLYVFPKKEVVILPVLNTSVEELASYLAAQLFQTMPDIHQLVINVEETSGQSASCFFPN